MKNVLLADDDYLARSYLKMLSAWERAEFCVVSDVKNGEEALEVIKNQKIDLVVTDMAMPLMDGIQLIREIRKISSYIYIIVLSCHDDFEFVKTAMQEGADEYVLKNTLNEESLYELVTAVNEKMRTEALEEKETGDAEQKAQEQDYNRRYWFFNQVLAGKIAREEYEYERKKAGVRGQYQNNAVIVVKLESSKSFEETWEEVEWESYCLDFLERLKKGLKPMPSEQEPERDVFYLGNGYFCCFIDLTGIYKGSAMRHILDSAASVLRKVCRKAECSYKIGISNVCMGTEALRQAYEQARTMLKLCFYEPDHIAYYEMGSSLGKELPREAEELVSRMDSLKYSNDKDGFIKLCRAAISGLKRERTESRMVMQWIHRLQQAGMAGSETETSLLHDIEDVSRLLEEMARQTFGHPGVKIADHVSAPVRIATEYAAAHYTEPVGLNDAARAAGVNGAYLSYLFSQEMGVGFANYIQELRVEYAKKLLEESSLKIRTVAEKAGFHDYHYFSKVFKKKNGISPAEYRSTHRGK